MSAAKLSNRLHWKQQSLFIIALFWEACQDEHFQNHWMTAETWAKLIAEYFDVSDDVHFNAKTLNKALVGNRALAQEMDNINKDVLHTQWYFLQQV